MERLLGAVRLLSQVIFLLDLSSLYHQLGDVIQRVILFLFVYAYDLKRSRYIPNQKLYIMIHYYWVKTVMLNVSCSIFTRINIFLLVGLYFCLRGQSRVLFVIDHEGQWLQFGKLENYVHFISLYIIERMFFQFFCRWWSQFLRQQRILFIY